MAKIISRKETHLNFSEKQDYWTKIKHKRDPKSGLGLWTDPGLPKRESSGSSAIVLLPDYFVWLWKLSFNRKRKEILSLFSRLMLGSRTSLKAHIIDIVGTAKMSINISVIRNM